IGIHPFSCALRANASYNYLLVNGKRRLTPREMFRLQGFPDTFKIVVSDMEARKQAGNSVVVPKIEAVAKAMLKAMKQQPLPYPTQGNLFEYGKNEIYDQSYKSQRCA
ncbi:MAG: DNA cytosine methyltransferase, partial [Elusimicrobia bacterium]|nr:DNA cytosine methyltransferase [Elusimicrobiota bacterium]